MDLHYLERYLEIRVYSNPLDRVLIDTIYFASNEIRGIISYRNGQSAAFFTSENGYSHSITENAGKSVKFSVHANKYPKTRYKAEKLREYVNQGKETSFIWRNFKSFLEGLPNSFVLSTDVNTYDLVFNRAAIGFNDNAFDSSMRNKGLIVSEANSSIEIEIREQASLVSFMPCRAVSMQDFELYTLDIQPYSGTNYIVEARVQLSPNSTLISQLNSPISLKVREKLNHANSYDLDIVFGSVTPTQTKFYDSQNAFPVIQGIVYELVGIVPFALVRGSNCTFRNFLQEFTL